MLCVQSLKTLNLSQSDICGTFKFVDTHLWELLDAIQHSRIALDTLDLSGNNIIREDLVRDLRKRAAEVKIRHLELGLTAQQQAEVEDTTTRVL